MGEYGELYAAGRARIIDLVADADPTTPVPSCPAWTVKDVLAHVAGIPADIIAGRLDGVATDPWTQAQVDARRDRTVAEIAQEWRETGPQIDAIVDSFGPAGAQLLFDLATHELDLRAALGAPAPDALPVYDVALGFVMDNLLNVALDGRGPVRFAADDAVWTVGAEAEPEVTLTTTKRELMRAVAGRRSRGQIASMQWDGDPTPYLDLFASGPFTFPPNDVVE